MPDADTELLIESVKEAGGIARQYFGGRYKAWRKSDGNPVSEADIAIDRFLKQRLSAARPDYGWISEETEDDRTRFTRTRNFVVDPIDGTHGFLKGRPQFTIVAGVLERGRPVAAAVYNPMTEEMYDATQSGGARKNGVPIHVSAARDFDAARLLATRKFLEPSHWSTPWPENVTVQTRASIAYRMVLVAEGAFDAMISLSRKSDWDLAAADLIVHEAGGIVSDAHGAPLIYNRDVLEQGSVICAPASLHRLLLARLREHMPAL